MKKKNRATIVFTVNSKGLVYWTAWRHFDKAKLKPMLNKKLNTAIGKRLYEIVALLLKDEKKKEV